MRQRRCRGKPRLRNPEPLEEHERGLASSVGNGACQEIAGSTEIAASVRIEASVHEFVGLPLPLRERASRPFDVRASTAMATLEERDPGPDVDGLFVLPFEVVVEPGKQEPLDQRVAIRLGGFLTGRRVAQRLCHLWQLSSEARLL